MDSVIGLNGYVNPKLFDIVLRGFTEAMRLNLGPMVEEAKWLLGQLATWHLVSASIGLMLGVSIRGVMHDLFVMSIKVMIFIFLITHLTTITTAFADTMIMYGLRLGGSTMTPAQFQQPGTLFANGINGLKPLIMYIENMGFVDKLTKGPVIFIYAILIVFAILCYFLIAAHIVMAVIEFQLISAFSLVLIPWGVVAQTAFMAEGAIGGVISSAVRLGVLAFVMSLINPVLLDLALPAEVLTGQDIPYWHAVSATAGAALLLLISWVVPNFAAALLGSGPAITGQAVVGMIAGAAGGAYRGARRAFA